MEIFAQLDENNICVALIKTNKAPTPEHIAVPNFDESQLGKEWNGNEFVDAP